MNENSREVSSYLGSTVFVVDDHPQARECLRGYLAAAGLRVEVFDSAQSFLAACRPGTPGCLILDLHMPGMSGLELQRSLAEKGFRLPIIMVSGDAEVAEAVQSMKQGSFEFLEKPIEPAELLVRVTEVLARDLGDAAELRKRRDLRKRFERVSEREREVLRLLVAGKSSKAIAGQIGISVSTVNNHRANLMKKLKADTVADVLRIVLLMDPDLAFIREE